MEIRAGELVAKALKEAGVTRVFGLCGGHTVVFMNGLTRYGIELVDTHHEEHAVMMADAWARATGEVGVAMVTAGPGVANAVPGAIFAQEAKSPVLLIGGRYLSNKNGMGDGQELDQLAVMKPITKWAMTCYQANRIPEFVITGIRNAVSGRPGVAFLDIPVDVALSKIEEDEVKVPKLTLSKPLGDPTKIKEIVEKLLSAERPLIVAGSGLVWSRGDSVLKEFCEKTGVPFVVWKNGKGIIDEVHPQATGLFAAPCADAMLVLGSQLDFMMGFGQAPLIAAEACVMQVDICAAELGRNRDIDIGVVGDAKNVLTQMIDALPKEINSKMDKDWPWVLQSPTLAEAISKVGENSEKPIDLIDLCVTLDSKLQNDTIFVVDGGETPQYAAKTMKRAGMLPASFGHIGYGVPFAIALKMAYPEKPVVLLTGDGSLGICMNELSTAMRFKTPIHVIVANDEAWGMIQVDSKRWYGYKEGTGTTIGDVPFDKICNALGGQGEKVEKFEELSAAIDRALNSDTLSVLNVKIDNSMSMERTGGAMSF